MIEDYSQIASGASLGGYVKIKNYLFVGIFAIIMPKTKVGYSSVGGIGSGTVSNVDDNSTVIVFLLENFFRHFSIDYL